MPPVTVIKPKKTFSWNDIRELWEYRELLYFFVWRDLKVRYKQTAIGVAWAIFQPLVTMIVFTIFFGGLAKIPSDGAPYPIFVFIGLIIWQFFSTAVTDASNSLIMNQGILTKIYFPRLIFPISNVATKCVDFLIATFILAGLMIYYHFVPHLYGLLIFPLLLVLTFLLSTGIGFFLASLNVKYRDVRYALPFFIQIFLFITPVIYPPSIAGAYAWIMAFNPLTGIIKAARATILGNMPINWFLLCISAAASVMVFLAGLVYFKKTEKYFADII